MEPFSVLLLLCYAACSMGAAVMLNTTAPTVDLGYEIYTGIRYAAPPTRELRWQKPHAPALNRSQTISATDYPPRCPQSPHAPLPEGYNFTESGLGNEDCLFLSVFARPGARGLPVMVWIHGGGYGTGQGDNEFWELLNTNVNDFILVLIQYRLGAFGFLSSEDLVSHGGTPNVGLYDIHFSLEWVQNHIEAFGGDNQRVTISGESAGAGAVMLMTMANGGGEGTSLFTNAIVASPYLPMQWNYDGLEPTQAYYRLAKEVGCTDEEGRSFPDQAVFGCLLTMDSSTLQNASAYISGGSGGLYGQWAFLPVTDGALLRERPSAQLAAGKVNGLRMLSGNVKNNANEGAIFVPQNITDASDFDEYLRILFPLMSTRALDRLDKAYWIPPQVPGPLFSTLGSVGPTALNQSEYALGQQQRANNLYAETTFVCPSYWLASAYSGSSSKDGEKTYARQAWKYQFSVPPSEHGADLDAYQAFNREALGEGTMNTA
ncbi:Cholinesterase [Cytospora mali]|uniref:Carboxylic ester hydrolase n=1 Tax=Cytospora mali TaxID=578113 RepID=A0A194VE12_CYTMA|nr:Cholinesterase [Valsa mali var. pyri (nom. inval.)]